MQARTETEQAGRRRRARPAAMRSTSSSRAAARDGGMQTGAASAAIAGATGMAMGIASSHAAMTTVPPPGLLRVSAATLSFPDSSGIGRRRNGMILEASGYLMASLLIFISGATYAASSLLSHLSRSPFSLTVKVTELLELDLYASNG
jgi:hypothetical protein